MSSEPTNNPTAGRLIRYKVWPDPEPINDALPPVEAFTLDALPAEIRPWVEDISERMQCPPEFPAVGATVASSKAPQRSNIHSTICCNIAQSVAT